MDEQSPSFKIKKEDIIIHELDLDLGDFQITHERTGHTLKIK